MKIYFIIIGCYIILITGLYLFFLKHPKILKKGHIKRKVRKRQYKKPKKDEKASMIIIKGLEITDTKNIKL